MDAWEPFVRTCGPQRRPGTPNCPKIVRKPHSRTPLGPPLREPIFDTFRDFSVSLWPCLFKGRFGGLPAALSLHFGSHFHSVLGALGLSKNSSKCVTVVTFQGLAPPRRSLFASLDCESRKTVLERIAPGGCGPLKENIENIGNQTDRPNTPWRALRHGGGLWP